MNTRNYPKIDPNYIKEKGLLGQRKILEDQLKNGSYLVYEDEDGNMLKEFASGKVMLYKDKDGNILNLPSDVKPIFTSRG